MGFFPNNSCTVIATLYVNSPMKGSLFKADLTITGVGTVCPIATIYQDDVYGTFVKPTEIHFAGPHVVVVATVTPISGSLYGISGIFKGTNPENSFICKFRMIETPPSPIPPPDQEEPAPTPGPAPTSPSSPGSS
jgi:hypothetical protein